MIIIFVTWRFVNSFIYFIYLLFPSIATTEKPCALYCSPAGKDQPILLTEKVMDGTSCGQHGLDICADGRCQVWVTPLETGYICTWMQVHTFVMHMCYFFDGMLQYAWPRLNVSLCTILKYFKLFSLATQYLK